MTDNPHALAMDDKGPQENSDIVSGFKDTLRSVPADQGNDSLTPMDAGDAIQLVIKCPSIDGLASECTILSANPSERISDIKNRIEISWPGKPKPEGMRFFKSGQLLTDTMTISEFVKAEERCQHVPVHLVIRPGAWGEPIRPSLRSRRNSSHAAQETVQTSSSSLRKRAPNFVPIPTPTHTRGAFLQPHMLLSKTLLNSPLPTSPLAKTTAPHISLYFRRFAQAVEATDPSEYETLQLVLSWARARYVDTYEEVWNRSYGAAYNINPRTPRAHSLHDLAQEKGVPVEHVESAVDALERDVFRWTSIESEVALATSGSTHDDRSEYTYKQVDLQGLPYLLRTKPDAKAETLKILIERIQFLTDLVHKMGKLVNYEFLLEQSVSGTPHPQHARSELDFGLPATATLRPAHAQFPSLTPFRYLTRTFGALHREDVVNLALATFFLTFKMTILFYVFTRNASTFKRMLIASAAFAYVLFETYNMMSRQARLRRRALAQEQERAQARQPAQNETRDPSTDRTADTATGRTDSSTSDRNIDAALQIPVAPARFRTSSPLLLEFWIERLAYVGLAEEDYEIGLRVATSEGRIIPAATQSPTRPPRGSSAWLARTVHDFVVIPSLLFVATLVPEIEYRRRRAIEKREELIRSTARKIQGRQSQNSSNEDIPSGDGDQALPRFLQSEYSQRILRQQNQGRQIDIAQELEAAAGIANDEENGLDQVNMGFL